MKVITSELEGPAFVGSSSAPPVNSALETNDTDVEMHTLPINEPSSSSQGVASTAGASSTNPGAPQLPRANHSCPRNISISSQSSFRPPSRHSSVEPASPSQHHFSIPGHRYRPSVSSARAIGPSLIAISVGLL